MASPLTALSPLDGRYARSADPLRPFFSEYALIRSRVRVELAWLMALAAEPAIAELKPFSRATLAGLKQLPANFSEGDSQQIKDIEAETNHDVKAIEYWLKARLGRNREVQSALEFIHFAATSEDINNLSYALLLPESREQVMLPKLDESIAPPKCVWEGFRPRFVQGLGLKFNPYTTQIEPHDSFAELLDAYAAANTVLLDLDRDLWGYISLGYFRQTTKRGEVGSSTMPHKGN